MNEEKQEFSTGAVRNKLDDVRFDLISPQALRRLAATYAEGANKYGDNNFRKGMPTSALVNHLLKHIFDYIEGADAGEDSLAHAAWGIFTLMEQESEYPELDDLYFRNSGAPSRVAPTDGRCRATGRPVR